MSDHELLQRERKDDIPGWLWTAACLVVLALSLMFMASLAWGVARVARTRRRRDGPAGRRPPRRVRPRTAPSASDHGGVASAPGA